MWKTDTSCLKFQNLKRINGRSFIATGEKEIVPFFYFFSLLGSHIVSASAEIGRGRSRFYRREAVKTQLILNRSRASHRATYKLTVLLMVTDWFCTIFPSNELLLARRGQPLPFTWLVAIAIFNPLNGSLPVVF